MDGGDIVYHSFEERYRAAGDVRRLLLAPQPTATLKSGIENMLKHYVPEVVGVEAV